MRIAFISHEFPPETGGGGIGTYLECVIPALAARGHDVLLICGGTADAHERHDGYEIRKIACGRQAFAVRAAEIFGEEHARRPIDIVEVTDFAAWGLEVQRKFPGVPSVVKLHTPLFVINELNWREPTLAQQWRMGLGAWRRGRPWPKLSFRSAIHELERETILRADAVASPTLAVLQRVAQEIPQGLAPARVYPLPITPSAAALSAAADGGGGAVTYAGRLEPRKGVLHLAAAVPKLVRRHPDIRFLFAGPDTPSGVAGKTCGELIPRLARKSRHMVEILPEQPREKVLGLFARAKICVFPSHWESFGIVVLEAMAAGRPVVVTKGSGMAELVEDRKTGLTVEPRDPAALCEVISKLWSDEELRRRLGGAARDCVLRRFSVDGVLREQIDHYQEVIEQHRARRQPAKFA